MKFFILLIIFISGFAQAQDSTVVKQYSSTLGIGEIMEIGNRSFKFKQLISDSRCPSDVTCVWAGEAKILMEIFVNGKISGEEILVISGGGQGSVALNNNLGKFYTLSQLSLKPYPKASDNLKPSDYILNLEVKETIRN